MPRKKKTNRSKQSKQSHIVDLSYGQRIGVTPRARVRLRYVTEGDLASGGAEYDLWSFVANGLYDVDLSGIGHQSPNFDRLMRIWDQYRVYKVQAKVTFINNSSTVPVNAAMYISNESTTEFSPGVHDLSNDDYTAARVLTVQGGSRDIATLSKTFDLRKFYGPRCMNEASYAGNSTANPTRRCFIHLGAYALDKVSAPDVSYAVEYIFHVQLEDKSFDEAHLED